MRRRLWVSAALTAPAAGRRHGRPAARGPGPTRWPTSPLRSWIQLLLATPVVLWGGWPFFERGWQSLVNRSLNMFTLIALGVGVAYLYSVVATVFPGLFPASLRDTPARWASTSRRRR